MPMCDFYPVFPVALFLVLIIATLISNAENGHRYWLIYFLSIFSSHVYAMQGT